VLHLGLVNVSDQAAADIKNMCGGVYRWSSTVYKVFRFPHPAKQQTGIYPITAQFGSLKNIMIAMRDSRSTENNNYFSINDHIRNYLESYWLKVNSSYASARAVKCTGNAVEAYMNLRSVLGDAICSEDSPGLIQRDTWTKDTFTAVAETADVGSFLMCQNLRPFNSDVLISATNSVGAQLSIELQFQPSQLNNIVAVDISALTCADAVCRIEGGELFMAW
jgi:hypothetical protein